MCGRIIAGPYSWAEIFALYNLVNPGTQVLRVPDDLPLAQSYNVKPTQNIEVAYQSGEGLISTSARWWFVPHWHRGEVSAWKATTFNAKIETAHEKPTFRNAWRTGRCIIPAAGYYEWTGPKGKRLPWHITVERNSPAFFFAGLVSQGADGGQSCAILTRAAEGDLADLHPRMPVILGEHEVQPWLGMSENDDTVIRDYGRTWDGRFRFHRVRPFGTLDDGPELIERDGFDL